MNGVLIITGPTAVFGSGHWVRMRLVALELRRRKIAVQLLCADADEKIAAPLPYSVVVLDRRDTAFNAGLAADAVKIAVDNRGQGREEADLVCDLLPHHEMNAQQYQHALASLILPPAITATPAAHERAQITLCEDSEAAFAAADFPPAERLSPDAFHSGLMHSASPALYFGQALFEALYLGKHVRLYPVSDYHRKLAVDLYSRRILEPNLLSALDGRGLSRFAELVISATKKKHE